MEPGEAARYAIYWTPPTEDRLAVLGDEWLGRDARSDRVVGGPPDGLRRAVWRKLVARPARYGFHATLRAPMRLVRDANEGDLLEAMRRLAMQLAPVALPRLGVAWLGDVLALRPLDPDGAVANAPVLRDFAQTIVESLDVLRAAPTALEIARHELANPTERRRALLLRWGYPHVAEQFRFHLSLTGELGGKTVASRRYLQALLAAHFAPVLDVEREIGALTLFVQPHPELDFVARASVPLAGIGAACVGPFGPALSGDDPAAADQPGAVPRSPSKGSARNAHTRAA